MYWQNLADCVQFRNVGCIKKKYFREFKEWKGSMSSVLTWIKYVHVATV
jgi:hypothetical protein